ncbi:MAG: hypothetical protein ACE5F1_02025 [Planctomycetota bacterium]
MSRRKFWLWPPSKHLHIIGIVVLASTYFAATLGLIVGPVATSLVLSDQFEKIRTTFVAEDVLLRALAKHELRSQGHVEVVEGQLSDHPDEAVKVELLQQLTGPELRCRFGSHRDSMEYRASFVNGALPAAFSWAAGQGDPRAPDLEQGDRGLTIRGRTGRMCSDPKRDNVFPLSIPGAWDIQADFVVRAGIYLDPAVEHENTNQANFRLAADLPLEHLFEPTDMDDFEVGRSNDARLVASFRGTSSSRGIVIRVLGHLWVGRPGETLLVETAGHSVVLNVTGNVYVLGDVRMVGPKDSLIIVAGSRGRAAFRDWNGNGRRDSGESLLGTMVTPGFYLRPREGTGLVYLGMAEDRIPKMQAYLVATHDVIVGKSGASVHGTVLAGGMLIRVGGREAGPLLLSTDTRFRDMSLPKRGLPIIPGSEKRERLTSIRLQPPADQRL